jgi:hypothetical protein
VTVPRTLDRTDAAASVLLAAGTVAYLVTMPLNLVQYDEGYFLYHAVRVLHGEVLYRDIFELITPLYIDLMAVVFRVFGATMATARAAAAVIQAGLVVVMYLTCRAVGVRRGLAVAAPLVYLTVAHPTYPWAVPHWLGSLLISLLLLIALDRRRARRAPWTAMQGVLLGLLVATRQPTGVVMAVGVSTLFLADRLADWRWGSVGDPPALGRLAILAAAAAAGLSIFGVHVAQAGVQPLIDQLVVHPLTGYREVNRCAWGYAAGIANYPYVALLKYLPLLVIPITLVRTASAWRSRGDRIHAETLLVLFWFATFSAASILYFPDYIHISFIMPVVLVLTAELLERGLRATGRLDGAIGGILAAALVAASGMQLRHNLLETRAKFPFPTETAFGRVDLNDRRVVDFVHHMSRLLDHEPGREMFIYPLGWPAVYLMAGARNPTRHDMIFPTYQSEQELQGVIAALERQRPRYVLLERRWVSADDPIGAYVDRHYRCQEDGLCLRDDVAAPEAEAPPAPRAPRSDAAPPAPWARRPFRRIATYGALSSCSSRNPRGTSWSSRSARTKFWFCSSRESRGGADSIPASRLRSEISL